MRPAKSSRMIPGRLRRCVSPHISSSDAAVFRQVRSSVCRLTIVEIVALVTLNLFRNYLNLAAQTEIDFPVVRVGQPGVGPIPGAGH